jgi:hypothetical protein
MTRGNLWLQEIAFDVKAVARAGPAGGEMGVLHEFGLWIGGLTPNSEIGTTKDTKKH